MKKTTELTLQIDKPTVRKWQIAKVNRKYIDIANAIDINVRTVRNAIRLGIATPTTERKLNEFFNRAA